MTTFDDLPDEVKFLILAQISPRDFVRFERVSKTQRSLINFYSDDYFKAWQSKAQFFAFLQQNQAHPWLNELAKTGKLSQQEAEQVALLFYPATGRASSNYQLVSVGRYNLALKKASLNFKILEQAGFLVQELRHTPEEIRLKLYAELNPELTIELLTKIKYTKLDAGWADTKEFLEFFFHCQNYPVLQFLLLQQKIAPEEARKIYTLLSETRVNHHDELAIPDNGPEAIRTLHNLIQAGLLSVEQAEKINNSPSNTHVLTNEGVQWLLLLKYASQTVAPWVTSIDEISQSSFPDSLAMLTNNLSALRALHYNKWLSKDNVRTLGALMKSASGEAIDFLCSQSFLESLHQQSIAFNEFANIIEEIEAVHYNMSLRTILYSDRCQKAVVQNLLNLKDILLAVETTSTEKITRSLVEIFSEPTAEEFLKLANLAGISSRRILTCSGWVKNFNTPECLRTIAQDPKLLLSEDFMHRLNEKSLKNFFSTQGAVALPGNFVAQAYHEISDINKLKAIALIQSIIKAAAKNFETWYGHLPIQGFLSKIRHKDDAKEIRSVIADLEKSDFQALNKLLPDERSHLHSFSRFLLNELSRDPGAQKILGIEIPKQDYFTREQDENSIIETRKLKTAWQALTPNTSELDMAYAATAAYQR
ncbi:MAG: hypothetical protein K0S08_1196 [Gammaproteobacteria bacterium]|nr:hypothetical protein [Gammaproteobacteria bacterium]